MKETFERYYHDQGHLINMLLEPITDAGKELHPGPVMSL
jgi:hypothetical protein